MILRRWLWLLPALAAVVLIAAAGWHYYQKAALAELLARPLAQDMTIDIPSGSSLRKIANAANTAGAPVSIAEFIVAANAMGIAGKMQAGYYEFSADDNAQTMLQAIASGKVAPAQRFTIIEGFNYRALRETLRTDKRLAQKLSDMSEKEIGEKLSARDDSLEGLFLPETYFFNRGDSDLDVLLRARQDMQKTLSELWAARNDDGLFENEYEALALASIVEKETGVAEERPLIASVFANRLRRGIPLQADPTVIYGLGETFDGNLTRAHLRDKTNNYNTYARRGLTPTPIAMPGRAAIAAVLNPPETEYYYFVATGDGGHVFSKTLREHNNAVNKYQRRLGKK